MKERPIMMSAPDVRAILEGRKTQTRRVIKHPPTTGAFVLVEGFWRDQPNGWWPLVSMDGESMDNGKGVEQPMSCPYGKPGDRLWVREAWWKVPEPSTRELRDGADTWPKPLGLQDQRVAYVADGDDAGIVSGWNWQRHSPIHMPRWASRITLEITDVRVQRIKDMDQDEAKAEGVSFDGRYWLGGTHPKKGTPIVWPTPMWAFSAIWDDINGPGSWDANPWVWALTFKRVGP